MMQGPQAHWLADGRRLHLNHGPIDLIVEAFGHEAEVQRAYEQAVTRFQTVLDELVSELHQLRRAATPGHLRHFSAPTARRMEAAVAPLADVFLTPMAAVAGSVADEMLEALVAGRKLRKAYVNNGGDCAVYLDMGQHISIALAGTGNGLSDRLTVPAGSPVRGIATSGWRGRSFSLGIADAVTVLGRSAAAADSAATVIANAVDLPGHPGIARCPACDLQPDSDLGARCVTVGVEMLVDVDVDAALDAGMVAALDLQHRGLIEGAAIFLAGRARTVMNEDMTSMRAAGTGVAARGAALYRLDGRPNGSA